jgi:hypothetical protein
MDNVTDLKVIQWEGMKGNYLVQDRDHWQAIVNTIKKYGLCKFKDIS